MSRKFPFTEEIIAKMKDEISKGKSRTEIARELDVPYKMVWRRTRDTSSKRGIPRELREKIRQEVLGGKSKRRVAIELGVSKKTIQYYTRDLWLTPFRKMQTPDRTLELIKALLRDGYALASDEYGIKEYYKLKEHFPAISKVKMHGRVIFYLEGKEDIAIRVFLEHMQKKIINYQELKQIAKIFRADLPKREKHAFLLRNRQRKLFKKQGVPKQGPLRENDDSFSFYYIRKYWSGSVA